VNPRQGEAGTRRVIEQCVAAGGESLGRRVLAEWVSETTPATILDNWAAMNRMGSIPIGSATRARILAQLREYAEQEFANLDRVQGMRERYAVDIVRWP
jgi:hypothetical protein